MQDRFKFRNKECPDCFLERLYQRVKDLEDENKKLYQRVEDLKYENKRVLRFLNFVLPNGVK